MTEVSTSAQAHVPSQARDRLTLSPDPAGTKWPFAAGLGFAVAFFFAFFITNTPDGNASDQKWHDYFASSGHRAELIVSGFLFAIAGLMAISFLGSLWSRIAAAGGVRPGPIPLLAAGLGATCIVIGGVMNAVISGAMAFGDMPEPSAETLRAFDNLSFPVITVGGMIAMGFAIAVLSIQARRSGVIGGALAGFGLVTAVCAVASFLFFPMLLVLIWFIVASIALLRAPAPADN